MKTQGQELYLKRRKLTGSSMTIQDQHDIENKYFLRGKMGVIPTNDAEETTT